jgi:ankyrin repeat protein
MTSVDKNLERISLGRDLLAEMSRETPDTDKCLFLIDKGARVNEPDADGNTPLILAAQWAIEEVVEPLLRAGARHRHTNNAGETAADIAERNGYENIVKMLTKYDRLCPPREVVTVGANRSKPKPRSSGGTLNF